VFDRFGFGGLEGNGAGKVFVKMLLPLITICFVISCHGCIGDPIYGPEKVKGVPNTFRPPRNPLSFLHPKTINGDIVLWVQVGVRKRTLWKIKANRDIPVSDFQVTVGKVPEGFEQLIPKPPKKFKPIPGEEYHILIYTEIMEDPNICSPHYTGLSVWIAESSNGG